MSLNSGLPTGRYERVEPSSTPNVSDQEWLDYGYLNGNSTHKATYPFQNQEPRTQQNSPYFLSREQWKNHIQDILAVPILGDNLEAHFHGSPSLPPLASTSPGSSQGHYESDNMTHVIHCLKTPELRVQALQICIDAPSVRMKRIRNLISIDIRKPTRATEGCFAALNAQKNTLKITILKDISTNATVNDL
ncbi:hypothetical protein F4703DRAFT_1933182 [Phycomyces blakesleeanus]